MRRIKYSCNFEGDNMIYNYPFFGFPNYMERTKKENYAKNMRNSFYNNEKKIPYSVHNMKDYSPNNSNSNNNSFFNLFGISLNFDDVLIICIILFLFYEKTDDYYLLLALVLLLLG